MGRCSISNAFSVSTIQDGVSPAVIEVSLATLLYDAYANGASTSAQEFAVTYTMKVGNETILEQNVTSVKIQTPNGVSIKQNTKTNSGCTFVVAEDASPSGVIGITMTTTKNGNLYNPSASITVAPNVRGENGERGKVGRFYYYSGFDWDASNDDDTFVVNDAQVPYFSKAGSNGDKYYVFNREETPSGGSMTMAQMAAETSVGGQIQWNSAPWDVMYDDFKYLITEAIFAEFAHFGSAIISGDWMISQHGIIYDENGDAHTIDATHSYDGITVHNAFTYFDSSYPNSSKQGSINFVPNYCVDLLTGATYQQNAYVEGTIYTSSIGTKFKDVVANNETDTRGNRKATEIWVRGHEDGIWNFKLVPLDTHSRFEIYLPYNEYAYFGQRVIIYNTGTGIGSGQEAFIYSAADEGESLSSLRPLLGVVIEGGTALPTGAEPVHSFTPVKSIMFVNGCIELMCVPPASPHDADVKCDWAVVNIGTNFYYLEAYT